ncbi:uncharacterized protein LOC106152970 [Lingula anatina]|uniref:Uncharacterized protein LOC106152970 n=1 Tax=Lingula anatina TaxID=7574 RepID=A0A1S3HAK0_LINAN|nr:uncharacterized protein LOC106152970 [Lingula anatina]|eukprot:XP_013382174.1 uncharacterized protein LOC106152970 [Lingula anatina]
MEAQPAETSSVKGLTTETSASSTSPKVLIIAAVVCGLIAMVAIIIAAFALSKQSSPSITIQGKQRTLQAPAAQSSSVGGSQNTNVNTKLADSNRIWLVATGHGSGAYGYIDNDGFLAGAYTDIIDAVCTEAGMDCRIVWDKYSNCYFSEPGQHSFGGRGLHGRWYDACTGWYATVERKHIFAFSKPFFKPTLGYFWVKLGNPGNFNHNDITGKKIGFVDGWFTNEKCMARWTSVKGSLLPKSGIVYVADYNEMYQAIQNNTVDAGFVASGSGLLSNGTLTRLSDGFGCATTGAGMMTRKDSGFNKAWNVGFEKLVASGRFKKLCDDVREKHKNLGELSDCTEA